MDQVEAIATAFESERFRVQYGPIGPQWCVDSTLERIARASADHDRRVHMHLLESPRQREWLDFAYPQGILRHLDDIGFLSPRLAVAHGVQLTEPECELLAERGVTVAVNTSSNLRLRSGVAPLSRFVDTGLRFGFGLDGGAHDDDQDYFRDLRLAWRLHNGSGLAPALPPARLFEGVYRDGARIIDGTEDYGTIRAGARADLVALDYGAMSADFLVESEDEVDVLLTRATAGHVRHLIVAGRDVLRDGRLADLDLAEMEAELMARARKEAGLPPEQPPATGAVARRCAATTPNAATSPVPPERGPHPWLTALLIPVTNVTVVTPDPTCADRRPPTSESAAPDTRRDRGGHPGAALGVLAVITDPHVLTAILEYIDTGATRAPPIVSSRAHASTAPPSMAPPPAARSGMAHAGAVRAAPTRRPRLLPLSAAANWARNANHHPLPTPRTPTVEMLKLSGNLGLRIYYPRCRPGTLLFPSQTFDNASLIGRDAHMAMKRLRGVAQAT